MATTHPYSNTYVFGRGQILFNRARGDGTFEGFRALGNCPGFTVNVEGEQFTHVSSEGGLQETDFTVPLSISRSAEITSDNFSAENLELFLAATRVTLAQTSGSVTNEVLTAVSANRTYQLGVSSGNPAGVRNVSAVTVSAAQGDSAATFATSTAYTVGTALIPGTPNGRWYVVTAASGPTGGSAPSFPTNLGTVTSGGVTLQDMGPISYTVTTDYTLDLSLGLVNTLSTGAIASAVALMPAGFRLNLHVDYTRPAATREQIATSASVSLTGELRFIADNASGPNRDLYCPSVTLSPSGELPLITGADLGTMTFSVGINKRDSITAAMYLDGRAVNT